VSISFQSFCRLHLRRAELQWLTIFSPAGCACGSLFAFPRVIRMEKPNLAKKDLQAGAQQYEFLLHVQQRFVVPFRPCFGEVTFLRLTAAMDSTACCVYKRPNLRILRQRKTTANS